MATFTTKIKNEHLGYSLISIVSIEIEDDLISLLADAVNDLGNGIYLGFCLRCQKLADTIKDHVVWCCCDDCKNVKRKHDDCGCQRKVRQAAKSLLNQATNEFLEEWQEEEEWRGRQKNETV